eukprot:TRINITY_DN6173_c0_g1_i2.p1 TRINITY_DN6173_c0_g1~~TRINITY_DN6173_c0_g1_i2.p1  ORF type:complete len:365 (+),score=71.27 TRINITY_DN6173_c0_g1_i2:71-1096(+)
MCIRDRIQAANKPEVTPKKSDQSKPESKEEVKPEVKQDVKQESIKVETPKPESAKNEQATVQAIKPNSRNDDQKVTKVTEKGKPEQTKVETAKPAAEKVPLPTEQPTQSQQTKKQATPDSKSKGKKEDNKSRSPTKREDSFKKASAVKVRQDWALSLAKAEKYLDLVLGIFAAILVWTEGYGIALLTSFLLVVPTALEGRGFVEAFGLTKAQARACLGYFIFFLIVFISSILPALREPLKVGVIYATLIPQIVPRIAQKLKSKVPQQLGPIRFETFLCSILFTFLTIVMKPSKIGQISQILASLTIGLIAGATKPRQDLLLDEPTKNLLVVECILSLLQSA